MSKKARRILTDDEVRSMREHYAQDITMTYEKLSEKYDVGIASIHRIITGKSYLHVTQGINIARTTRYCDYTQTELDTMREEHEQGKTLKQIADERGHNHRQHIWHLLNTHKYPKPTPQAA